MSLKNIPLLLIIFIVIGIIVYFFYNSDPNTSSVTTTKEYFVDMTPTKKKVTFNDKVECVYYKKPALKKSTCKVSTGTYEQTPYVKKLSESDEEYSDLDSDLDSDSTYNKPKIKPKSESKSERKAKSKILAADLPDNFLDSLTEEEVINEPEIKPPIKLTKPQTNIIPSNFDTTNPDDPWDASFGMPLMSQNEQADYFFKMMENHKKYDQAIGEFYEYQTDNNTIIKTDTTIDPFAPSTKSTGLKNKPVSEIYNEQVAGPKAVPKKIKERNCMGIIYEDESSLNGGRILGTNLVGFDRFTDHLKSAGFGNEF